MADYNQYDPMKLGSMLKSGIGGGAYAPPTPMNPPSPVAMQQEQAERLDKTLSAAHDQLFILEERLNGVLSPSEEQCNQCRTAPSGPWVLARTMQAAEVAEALVIRLVEIQKRLVI